MCVGVLSLARAAGICDHAFVVHLFFFFNQSPTTEIYTLSLHDALPICPIARHGTGQAFGRTLEAVRQSAVRRDRKSTRLNSSHTVISYAVFCLKKKITETSGSQPTQFSP